MAKDQYVYAVARIHSKELSLLSGSVIEQLLGAKGYDECLQLLREKNWGDSDVGDAGGHPGGGTGENLGSSSASW